MNVKVVNKKASDNEYFHLDFHLSMNMLLNYILENYGYEGVIEYITKFTKAYHKPLMEQLKKGSLLPLKEYIEEIYKKEKWQVDIEFNEDNLTFSIESCPGVTHIIKNRQIPSITYIETYNTLYKVICENTPFKYNLLNYDKSNGKSTHIFTRRIKV